MVIEKFLELVKLDSPSLKEQKVANYIKRELEELNIDFYEDDAGKKINGECGNIIARINGNIDEIIMFSAHMDTVNPCVGVNPVIEDGVITSSSDTILGGDDKAGVAVLLELLSYAKSLNGNHKSIICIFSISEEIGILGAKNLDIDRLGRIDYAYVLDGEGKPGIAYNNAPYSAKGEIIIIGKEAHSGINPEEGINALVVLSRIISKLKIGRLDSETTCNIGLVEGGVATNIVMPSVKILFEARSLKLDKLDRLLKEVKFTFEEESKVNGAKCVFNVKKGTPGFLISEESKVIQNFKRVCNKLELEFQIKPCGGGSDTNIFNRSGIESIILGIGMEKVHTKDEYIKEIDILSTEKIVFELIK